MKKSFNTRTLFLTVCVLTLAGIWAVQPQTVTGAANKIDPIRIFDSQSVTPGNTIARFSDVYTVPAGKRLTVEHVSCAFALHPPDLLTCGIEEAFTAIPHSTAPAYTPAGSAETVVSVTTGQAVKVIFEAGENFSVVVHWGQPSEGLPGAYYAISGVLEDAH